PALSDSFHVSSAAAAWTSTAFGFAYALGMLVAGPLSDATGRRQVAVGGLLAAAGATAVVAIAGSFGLLLAARGLQGLAAAFYPPVALAYLTEKIQSRRRPVAVAVVISSFLAAAVLAPLAAAALSRVGG